MNAHKSNLLLLHFDSASKFEVFEKNFVINYTSTFLQKILKMAGYAFEEREVYHKTFLSFMLMVVRQIGADLHSNKKFQDSNEKEKSLLELHKSQHDLDVEDEKMSLALIILKRELRAIIKEIMIFAEFDKDEINEKSKSFFDTYTIAFNSVSDMYLRYKSRFPTEQRIKNQVLAHQSDFVSSFTSFELLMKTERNEIYLVSLPDQNFILKMLKQTLVSVRNTDKLRNELRVSNAINHHGHRKALNIISFKSREALVLEWVDGEPLSNFNGKLDVRSFLEMSRDIVSSLLAMHRERIAHLNLSSKHIIIEKNTKSLKIVGHSNARSFEDFSQNHYEDIIDKELSFISPEQTGLNGRRIDYRSDFYSLGTIFYELLTGKCPFEGANAMQLMRSHVFEKAKSVEELNPYIPAPISNLVSKLMEKHAEDRYKSAKGIIYDLDLMLSEYSNNHGLAGISLGQADNPETLLLSQKLYGRKDEYEILVSAFKRLTSNSVEIVFLQGESGTGKTSMIQELHKPISQQNSLILRGGCNYRNLEPYAPLIEAMKNFCDELLLKDKVSLANFKSRIIDAVGEEGKVLTNVVTNLALIIGPQPQVSDSFGVEGSNRFIYVFTKFIKAICSLIPIVFVLEDIQWLDSKSFELIEALISDKGLRNLMFIASYRENDIDEGHNVTKLLHSTRLKNPTFIELKNLNCETVNDIVSDALSISPLESFSLGAFIHRKTRGNLLYVNQMLKSLYDQNSIYFCDEASVWKWDASLIDEGDSAEDVISFLRQKIIRLDNSLTQQILMCASCIGNTFTLNFLKIIVNCEKGIEDALATGMITQCGRKKSSYRFIHNEMKQAAFSLIPSDNSNKIFWYMGVKLWKGLKKNELDENIYTVANLFIQAGNFVDRKESMQNLVILFMKAGKKAMWSTAYKEAYEYYTKGLDLLGEDRWSKTYDLCLLLLDEGSKAAYCISNTSFLDFSFDEITRNADCSLHLVTSYLLKIRSYNDKHLFEKAIDIAAEILKMIGGETNLSHYQQISDEEVTKAKDIISNISDEDVLSLQEMNSDKFSAITKILNEILSCSFRFNSLLMAFCSARIVQITVKHGISKYSCLGFNGMGAALGDKDGNLGLRFGELSLILRKKHRVKEFIPQCYLGYYGRVSHIFRSIHESVEPLYQAYRVGMEVGLYFMSSCCANAYIRFAFWCGMNLSKLLYEIEEINEKPFVQGTGNLASTHQAIINLVEVDIKDPSILNGKIFSVKNVDKKDFDASRAFIICCVIAYIFNNYPLAFEYIKVCQELNIKVPLFCEQLFFESLAALAFAKNKDSKDVLIRQAEESLKKLREHSQHAPENLMNKIRLIEAEIAAISKDISQADSLYEEAIVLSKSNGFVHEEGIAYERHGIFCIENGFTEKASQSLSNALICYKSWGAASKVNQILNEYISLLDDEQIPTIEEVCEEFQVEKQSQASVSALSFPRSYYVNDTASVHRKKRIRWHD